MSLKYTFTSAQHNSLLGFHRFSIHAQANLGARYGSSKGFGHHVHVPKLYCSLFQLRKTNLSCALNLGKERRCLQLTTVLTFYLFNELLMLQTLRHCGRSLLNFAFHFGLFLDSELNGDKLTVANEFPGGHQILCAVLHWASLIASYDWLGVLGTFNSSIWCHLNALSAPGHSLNTNVNISSSNSILMGHRQLWLYVWLIDTYSAGKCGTCFGGFLMGDKLESKIYSLLWRLMSNASLHNYPNLFMLTKGMGTHNWCLEASAFAQILLALAGNKTFWWDCGAEEVPCSINTLVPARRV